MSPNPTHLTPQNLYALDGVARRRARLYPEGSSRGERRESGAPLRSPNEDDNEQEEQDLIDAVVQDRRRGWCRAPLLLHP